MKRTRKAAPNKAQEKTAMSTATDAGQPNGLHAVLLDQHKPAEVRARVLLDVLNGHDPATQQHVLSDLFRHVNGRDPDAETLQMMERYEQALHELEQGAVRPATFLAEAHDAPPAPTPRVHVVTPDGQERYPALHPKLKLRDLRPGMTVYLDPRGSFAVGMSKDIPHVGQEGTFLRSLDGTHFVEATVQNERLMLYAAAPVLDALAANAVKHGDRLLVCPRRHVAFAVVPPESDLRHRFIDRSEVPEVIAERDIGKPHWILDHLVRRLNVLLFRPDTLARFDLRPRFAALLTGPAGCGKTLTIRAFLHEFSRQLVERTGRTDLGSRVVRVKVSALLSEWLGRSDKNIDELFDDLREVAAAKVETVRGEKLLLPVVLVLEEVEGLARRRGSSDAAVYDRILTTLLQRLDGPADDLGGLPLFVLSTSNRPDLIDSAAARRLGVLARFTRLDREGLAAVLDKKLKPHYPYAPQTGSAKGQERRHILEAAVSWLFGTGEGGQGILEVTLRDGRKLVKRRRDLLTGGLIEQAVAGAIDCTAFAAESAGGQGLTTVAVVESLRQHLDGLADTLSPENVADYLDLPDGAEAVEVRRLRPTGEPLPYSYTDLTN